MWSESNVGEKGCTYRCEEIQEKREPRNQESELETVVTQESGHWLYALKNKCVFRDVLKVVRDSESRIVRGS